LHVVFSGFKKLQPPRLSTVVQDMNYQHNISKVFFAQGAAILRNKLAFYNCKFSRMPVSKAQQPSSDEFGLKIKPCKVKIRITRIPPYPGNSGHFTRKISDMLEPVEYFCDL